SFPFLPTSLTACSPALSSPPGCSCLVLAWLFSRESSVGSCLVWAQCACALLTLFGGYEHASKAPHWVCDLCGGSGCAIAHPDRGVWNRCGSPRALHRLCAHLLQLPKHQGALDFHHRRGFGNCGNGGSLCRDALVGSRFQGHSGCFGLAR